MRQLLTTVLIVMALMTAGFARRLPKIFPATHASVPFENQWADTLGFQRYATMREINRAVEAGELVPIRAYCDRRLPRDRRYARPETVSFVETLDGEFHDSTGGRLVVDSAVRPTDVQRRLRRWNYNAAPATGERASSHERGTTVDLSRRMTRSQYRWLVVRLAYYEARGRIHVIEERGCFHVFVGEEPNDQETDFVYIEITYGELGRDPAGIGDGVQLQENPTGHGTDNNRVVGTCGDSFDDYPVGGYPEDCAVRPEPVL